MRKAASEGGEPAKDSSGRRYWVRAGNPTRSGGGGDEAVRRSAKARFLEPYRLAPERRGTLVEALAAAGVGDAESRELFATAVEYDIATFRQAAAEAEPSHQIQPEGRSVREAPAPDLLRGSVPTPSPGTRATPSAVAALGVAAERLAESIAGLSAEDRGALAEVLATGDPFRRGYGPAYLDALGAELCRLAAAAGAGVEQAAGESQPATDARAESPPALAPPEPPLGDAGRRFLRRVARVYEECLEARAVVELGEPFLATLQLLSPEAGIRLPAEPAVLAQALRAPSP